jgi:hypothetical protein
MVPMKTGSSRFKGSSITPEQKKEGRRFAYVFPFLLGIITFVIDGMLSFYSFWSSGLGMDTGTALGLTFGSLAFAIVVVMITYYAVRGRY